MKKFLAFFLLFTVLFAALSACAKQTGSENGATEANAGDQPAGDAHDDPGTGSTDDPGTGSTDDPGTDETFVPTLRFVVASDVHLTDTATIRDDKFAQMFTDAYAYSDAHETYQNLDGVFVVGDVANNGSATSLERFFTLLTNGARAGTVTRATLGNHEFVTDQENTVARFLAASGYEDDDAHLVIGGCHFIFLSPDAVDSNGNRGRGFTAAKQNWLAEQLASAAADDPTGKKPIFVFQHQHVKNTVYGSAHNWGLTDLAAVLARYPQVVDFSGHSHFPINDPRSVWQGEYTAFNTASFKGLEMDLAGVAGYADGVYPTDAEGGWNTTGGGRSDGGQYYIVEVDAENRILVQAFDVTTGQAVIEPIFIESVGDPAAFAYTNARAETETPPAFAEDAAVTTVVINADSATFRFPRTAGETYVQHYRCEVRIGDVLISTVYRLDDGFLFPAPATLTLPLTGLDPETEYGVRIIPVTAWGNEGEPLVFTFTTAEGIPADSPAASLVFSAAFGENNTATNAVTGTTLTKAGTPTTVYDEAQEKYVGVFGGSGSYEFRQIGNYYTALSDSFTFEIYTRLDEKPASGYVNPFSCQQAGGYGFQYESDGRGMRFVVNLINSENPSGKWYSVGNAVETGVWVHWVATYDGSTLTLYRNGQQVASAAATGTVKTPSTVLLAVGADATSDGSSNFTKCAIGCANVYSTALSASQVAGLYAAYTH